MNNEYIIRFINDEGVYQELTFRGVSSEVATAMANGLNKEPFGQVSLEVRESREIELN